MCSYSVEITSFQDVCCHVLGVDQFLCLYKTTILSKLTHSELDTFVDSLIKFEFDFSRFADLLRFCPREIAWILYGKEDDAAKMERLCRRDPRPLWDFLEEEDLCCWFGHELAARAEMGALYLQQDQKKV